MNEALFSLKSIGYSHQGQPSLFDKLSLDIFPHDRIGIIGENGSGKTTLLHLMLGHLPQQDGQIFAFGKLLCEERDFVELRRLAGLLYQRSADQLCSATVEEEIYSGLLKLGKSQSHVQTIAGEMLNLLGLEGYEKREINRLSVGERRRVALASVLAVNPEIVLFDEPTAGLDKIAVGKLSGVLNELGLAKLIVSHKIDFLKSVTDRIYQIKDRKLVIYED